MTVLSSKAFLEIKTVVPGRPWTKPLGKESCVLKGDKKLGTKRATNLTLGKFLGKIISEMCVLYSDCFDFFQHKNFWWKELLYSFVPPQRNGNGKDCVDEAKRREKGDEDEKFSEFYLHENSPIFAHSSKICSTSLSSGSAVNDLKILFLRRFHFFLENGFHRNHFSWFALVKPFLRKGMWNRDADKGRTVTGNSIFILIKYPGRFHRGTF